MSAENVGQLTLVLLAFATASTAPAWTSVGRRIWAPISVVLLAAAAIVGAVPDDVRVDGRGLTALLVALAGALAVSGGGPVTARVFAIVDRQEHTTDAETIDSAGRVLRGGAWIGALERAAVFATLVGGWPEGLAIVLALKGLGRYPELRNGQNTGAAERFIIGTFTSVLWAAACAGVVRLVGPA
ncbi:MAG: hypothetical protein JWO11_2349 [Nocardioides sp.]|nr:hypothetical protein [Nocardioides sp.]